MHALLVVSSVTGGDDDRQSEPETAFSANEGTQHYTRPVIGVHIHRWEAQEYVLSHTSHGYIVGVVSIGEKSRSMVSMDSLRLEDMKADRASRPIIFNTPG